MPSPQLRNIFKAPPAKKIPKNYEWVLADQATIFQDSCSDKSWEMTSIVDHAGHLIMKS
jgi:hypothetical protein